MLNLTAVRLVSAIWSVFIFKKMIRLINTDNNRNDKVIVIHLKTLAAVRDEEFRVTDSSIERCKRREISSRKSKGAHDFS